MGCGASKQQHEKLKSYKLKLEELGQINDQLAKQIADLRDVKNKRKPIYIIKDQEVEELTSYKEELERKFLLIEKEITAEIPRFIQIFLKFFASTLAFHLCFPKNVSPLVQFQIRSVTLIIYHQLLIFQFNPVVQYNYLYILYSYSYKLLILCYTRLNKQLQIQAKVEPKKKRKTTKPIDIDDIADEEEWKKNMMNDNDITIKPFDDAQLEIQSDNILKKNIHNNSSQSDILMLDSQQNIKKQIANAEKIEEINHQEQQQQFQSQKIIIQNDQINEQNNIDNQSKQQTNQQDLHKIKLTIQEALGQDLQAYNDEIKNKLFSQDQGNQPQQTLKNSEIEICFNEQSLEQFVQSPERNISTLPKKTKQNQPQTSTQVQNQYSQQLFIYLCSYQNFTF